MQEHHHPSRHGLGDVATVVGFDHRQREIDTCRHAAARNAIAILHHARVHRNGAERGQHFSRMIGIEQVDDGEVLSLHQVDFERAKQAVGREREVVANHDYALKPSAVASSPER